jgi:hypothetical protein
MIKPAGTGSTDDSPRSTNDSSFSAIERNKSLRDNLGEDGSPQKPETSFIPVHQFTPILSDVSGDEDLEKQPFRIAGEEERRSLLISDGMAIADESHDNAPNCDFSSILDYPLPHAISGQSLLTTDGDYTNFLGTREGSGPETSSMLDPSSITEGSRFDGGGEEEVCNQHQSMDDLLSWAEMPPAELVLDVFEDCSASPDSSVKTFSKPSDRMDELVKVDTSHEHSTNTKRVALSEPLLPYSIDDESDTDTISLLNKADSSASLDKLDIETDSDADTIFLLEEAQRLVATPPTLVKLRSVHMEGGVSQVSKKSAEENELLSLETTTHLAKEISTLVESLLKPQQQYPQTPNIFPVISKGYTGATVSPTPEKSVSSADDVSVQGSPSYFFAQRLVYDDVDER